MSVQSRATLKTFFETNDTPTDQQFIDLIDSLLHVQDPIATGGGGTMATQAEAQQGVEQAKYMSPFLTDLAIKALVRLANIPQLKVEVDTKDNTVRTDLRGGIIPSLNTLEKLRAALVASIATKELAFTKNSAFNKYFGVTYGEVARGNRTILQGTFRIQNHTTASMAQPWCGSITASSFISVMHVPGSYFKYRINHNYGSPNYLVFMNGEASPHHVFVKTTDRSANYIEFEVSIRDNNFIGFSSLGDVWIDFQLLEMNNF